MVGVWKYVRYMKEHIQGIKTYMQSHSRLLPDCCSSFARLPAKRCKPPHQNPNVLHVGSGALWSPGVADASDVFWFAAGCEVHLEAALGWGLLFSTVRHEARTLIRTHLLVRETPRSDYSSSLISFPPRFSCSAENSPALVWQTDATTRRWHWTTVSNLEDFAGFHRSKSWKGTRPTVSHIFADFFSLSAGDELKRGAQVADDSNTDAEIWMKQECLAAFRLALGDKSSSSK